MYTQSQIGGISSHLVNTDAQQVQVGSADYYCSPTLKLPKKGITVMYGHRGASNVVTSMARERHEGICLALVEFKINIGRWNSGKQRFEDFSDSRFLNLPARTSAPVLDDINRRWNQWLALEGKSPERFPRRPSMNMHLLDKLIDVGWYESVAAIAYDVMTDVGRAKFLTIFDESAIDHDSIVVGPFISPEVVFSTCSRR